MNPHILLCTGTKYGTWINRVIIRGGGGGGGGGEGQYNKQFVKHADVILNNAVLLYMVELERVC